MTTPKPTGGMWSFLVHCRLCPVCRRFPRDPCAHGLKLFELGAAQLIKRFEPPVEAMRN